MLIKNELIHIDIIDLKHTDEELALFVELLQTYLEATTHFIDEEEKLGILNQTIVDLFTKTEDMIQDLLAAYQTKDNVPPPTLIHSFLTCPSIDEESNADTHIHRKHNQNEL